jgi:selenocysteine lyase/cysteine desulfurase
VANTGTAIRNDTHGLAEIFGCDAEEIAITRNASESLEILLMGLDLKSGDEILTTTQDYPRMLTTLKQRELREGLKLNLIKIPIAPANVDDIATAFERAVTPKTKLILVSHQINLTGQILPVKKVCDMARARGIETIVDGAHSFAQFDFKREDLGCDYFGTSLTSGSMPQRAPECCTSKRKDPEGLGPNGV